MRIKQTKIYQYDELSDKAKEKARDWYREGNCDDNYMMSTPKHTPGPWAVEPRQWDHGASLAIVAPNNGYIVAIVPFDEDIQTVDEPDYETVKRHPDDVPNAHLIAAAPAMYEALQATLAYFMRSKQSHAPEVQVIREALAQAEGRG